MLLYEEESYKIRGACFNVYNSLGGGSRKLLLSAHWLKSY